MAHTCSSCGAERQGAAKFCTSCGKELAAGADLAREKRARVTAEEKKGSKLPWLAGGAAVVLALAVFLFAKGGPVGMGKGAARGGAPAAAVALYATDGMVRVPLAELADGRARFYSYSTGSTVVRFFALPKPDGSIGVALDACNACFRAKQGYRDAGDQVVCNNCGMAFQSTDVGIVTGGCNPIPLEHDVKDGMILVRAADLEKNTRYF